MEACIMIHQLQLTTIVPAGNVHRALLLLKSWSNTENTDTLWGYVRDEKQRPEKLKQNT